MNSYHKSPRARTHSKTETYFRAPLEIRGLDLCLPPDVSLGASYTDWGEEYSAVRLPDTKPYIRKIAKPLSLAARLLAVPSAPIVSQRPSIDPREVDRLCSDPVALRAFLVEKQRQIDAFAPKRKSAFAEISGALSGGAL